MLLSLLLVTILVARASSETAIQSCACSLCTCTAYPANNAAPTAESPAATTSVPTTPLDCGDWEKFEGKCYKFINSSIPFASASKRCRDLGGQLASIHSERENTFFIRPNFFKRVSIQQI